MAHFSEQDGVTSNRPLQLALSALALAAVLLAGLMMMASGNMISVSQLVVAVWEVLLALATHAVVVTAALVPRGRQFRRPDAHRARLRCGPTGNLCELYHIESPWGDPLAGAHSTVNDQIRPLGPTGQGERRCGVTGQTASGGRAGTDEHRRHPGELGAAAARGATDGG
jgi:hypothetical protein